jgi:hypothetical protein
VEQLTVFARMVCGFATGSWLSGSTIWCAYRTCMSRASRPHQGSFREDGLHVLDARRMSLHGLDAKDLATGRELTSMTTKYRKLLYTPGNDRASDTDQSRRFRPLSRGQRSGGSALAPASDFPVRSVAEVDDWRTASQRLPPWEASLFIVKHQPPLGN